MAPHFATIEANEPEAVEAVKNAIEARLVALLPSETAILNEGADQ